MSDYVIVSTAVIDDITLSDKVHIGRFLGGAGIYALCGSSLWSDSVKIHTGVGEDFYPLFGGWFKKNHLLTSGLKVLDKNTAVSNIQYLKNGERVETPSFSSEHYKKLEAIPEDFTEDLSMAKGLYIFKEADLEYWKKVLKRKKELDIVLCWEINASSCVSSNFKLIKKIASHCEIFSINMTEAQLLTNSVDFKIIVAKLLEFNCNLVYLRDGGNGAFLISQEKTLHVPIIKNIKVIDPTGAGNSSTAAVLVGFCQNKSLLEIGEMGGLSAARCIEQYGPINDLSAAIRKNILSKEIKNA